MLHCLHFCRKLRKYSIYCWRLDYHKLLPIIKKAQINFGATFWDAGLGVWVVTKARLALRKKIFHKKAEWDQRCDLRADLLQSALEVWVIVF